MSGRKLDNEERQVWKKVARTVSPRRKEKGKGSAKPLPSREDFANMLRLPPETKEAPRNISGSLDENRDKKTRRGLVNIDAKIDLHDLTQDKAKAALQKAVMRASNRNHKCLLVVTGKGVRLNGVLRRNFTGWLNDPVIRPLIANYAQAHIKHGGTGAWYVFLKG